MAVRTFTTAGVNNLWSNAANWDTPPGDTDSAVIPLGQTCIYDMDNSAWATGLAGLVNTGTFRFITDGTVTYLKMAGNIAGTGTLYVGNSTVDFIPAPTPPAITVATIAFNGAYGITMTGPIYMYGEERQTWAKLAANVAAGDSVIVLDRGMALRQGDLLGMGRNTAGGVATAHEVLFYVAGTKTVTLTAAIGTQARVIGDLVVCRTKSITISTSSQTINASHGGVCRGVRFLRASGTPFAIITVYNWTIAAVCFDTLYALYDSRGATVTNSVLYSAGTYYFAAFLRDLSIDNCAALGTFISGSTSALSAGAVNITNCAAQNSPDLAIGYAGDVAVQDFSSANCATADIVALIGNATFRRAVFNSVTQIIHITYRSELHLVQSYDHGQVANAYRAWMRGGIIVSDTTTKPTGHLQSLNFQLASAISRMRRDYTFWVENGQVVSITVPARKDFAGGMMPVVKLFDADYPDPWLDAVNCAILASDTMTDVVDTWDDLLISYTATERKQVTLRMEAIGATGNVYFSPENVEKLLSGGGGISRSRIIGGV